MTAKKTEEPSFPPAASIEESTIRIAAEYTDYMKLTYTGAVGDGVDFVSRATVGDNKVVVRLPRGVARADVGARILEQLEAAQ